MGASSGDGVELRLAIGRHGLGLELARPARIACAEVTELLATLPGAKFPLDVSGGVARFRHRRGQLESMTVEIASRDVERWAAPRLKGILSTASPEVSILVRESGATIALTAPEDPTESAATKVLAFELLAAVEGDDFILCVADARGSGLATTATGLAIAAATAILGDVARRTGATFRAAGVSDRIARSLLPDAGARAASAGEMRWVGVTAVRDTWVLQARAQGANADPREDAVYARETNALLIAADDARHAGDLPRARALDLAALERAPRHPEISRRIAEIDQRAGGRAEAAIATLADAGTFDRLSTGMLLGELLIETGDVPGAIAALLRVGDDEPVPSLAARALELAAELTKDPHDALNLLDRALARSPRTSRLRWARMRARIGAGRLDDALADVEHLEAQAAGAQAKYLVFRRAGDAWSQFGFRTHAASIYERALRFAPDAPDALAGVGAALVADGRVARGVALLTRAVDVAEQRGEPAALRTIELARALAEKMDDLPAAIARVRAIAISAKEAPIARGLEGRWRADLGDVAGAALAFAQLRDLATRMVEAPEGARGPKGSDDERMIVDLLASAAEFEEGERHDLYASQRHLAAALRLAPRDPSTLRAYRDVGAKIAAREMTKPLTTTDPTGARLDPPRPAREPAKFEVDDAPDDDDAIADDADAFSEESTYAHPLPKLVDEAGPSEAEAVAHARVEELTRRLQINPGEDTIVDELSQLLQALGRSHELLALLSARLEDAPEERKKELIPATRTVLQRLERDARAEGRDIEAQLFHDALSMMFTLRD